MVSFIGICDSAGFKILRFHCPGGELPEPDEEVLDPCAQGQEFLDLLVGFLEEDHRDDKFQEE